MGCQHVGRLGIELDFLGRTDINFGEVVFVDFSILQHLTLLEQAGVGKYLLVLQFLLGSEYEPGGIQLLVLLGNGLGLGSILGRQLVLLCREVCHGSVQFLNADILGSQFGLQFLDALSLGHQFLRELVDGTLQLGRVVLAGLQHLLQLVNLLAVLFHLLADELDIGCYLLACARRAFGHSTPLQVHTVLGRIDLTEAFGDIIECTHHLVQLGIPLVQFQFQRIVFSLQLVFATT